MTQASGKQHASGSELGSEPTSAEQETKGGIPNPETGAGIGATGPNSFEPEEAEPPNDDQNDA